MKTSSLHRHQLRKEAVVTATDNEGSLPEDFLSAIAHTTYMGFEPQRQMAGVDDVDGRKVKRVESRFIQEAIYQFLTQAANSYKGLGLRLSFEQVDNLFKVEGSRKEDRRHFDKIRSCFSLARKRLLAEGHCVGNKLGKGWRLNHPGDIKDEILKNKKRALHHNSSLLSNCSLLSKESLNDEELEIFKKIVKIAAQDADLTSKLFSQYSHHQLIQRSEKEISKVMVTIKLLAEDFDDQGDLERTDEHDEYEL